MDMKVELTTALMSVLEVPAATLQTKHDAELAAAQESGRQEGIAAGDQAGYTRGFSEGHSKGYSEGLAAENEEGDEALKARITELEAVAALDKAAIAEKDARILELESATDVTPFDEAYVNQKVAEALVPVNEANLVLSEKVAALELEKKDYDLLTEAMGDQAKAMETALRGLFATAQPEIQG